MNEPRRPLRQILPPASPLGELRADGTLVEKTLESPLLPEAATGDTADAFDEALHEAFRRLDRQLRKDR